MRCDRLDRRTVTVERSRGSGPPMVVASSQASVKVKRFLKNSNFTEIESKAVD